MLTLAARWDILTLPHAAQLARVPGQPPSLVRRAPASNALAKILTDLQGADPELFAFERLAATTGARRGELAALRLDDLLGDAVRIDEAVKMERIDSRAVISVGRTKNGRDRTVLIDQRTQLAVMSWVEKKRRLVESIGGGLSPQSLVFSKDPAGLEPAHPDAWSRRWRRWCERQGANINQHSLRHHVAS